MVTLSTSNAGKRIRVVVEDNGCGIEPHVLAQMFDAFEQAEPAREKFGGLGLGLAIAKGLVLLHGGSIRAESEGEGKGARVTVELPLLGESREEPGLFTPS